LAAPPEHKPLARVERPAALEAGGRVRVRFAPSPTGLPHVGNVRTALFNWLFARHTGGTFVLRIEDTDTARKVEGAEEAIMGGLKWLGLDWDEGPIRQSGRLDLYHRWGKWLVDNGFAYYCWCASERLEKMRADQMAAKQPPGYDRHCRDLTPEQRAEMAQAGRTPVIRFKMPLEGETVFHDLIRGDISFQNSTQDDFVLLKSDGYPTYHLANVVDDHDMAITHVLRADEWLSSTPRHKLLYQAFGWQPPQFAHLPMILGPDRSKLSKRHGATAITEYRDQGYTPEAMFNFLSLLGWSLDDKTELMSKDDIVRDFTIERVSKTAAIFNKEKLDWMNGMYLRQLSALDFAARALPFLENGLPPAAPRPLDLACVAKVLPLVQERAKRLDEVAELTAFFFGDKLEYDAKLLTSKTLDAAGAKKALNAAREKLEAFGPWQEAGMEDVLRPLAVELGLSNRDFFGALRVAVTGRVASPPLTPTMAVLGKEGCLARIRAAVEKLG
jgi:glutamyl-tRNA synthetase